MARGMKIERRPLGEQVTQHLRRLITAGELPPGQRLVEEQLAATIGTSRTPIREALHRLEQENLVVRRGKGGYKVRPISTREVEEYCGVRAALESYAVELAARHLTPSTLARLARNVDSFADALEAGDKRRLVELNTEFHAAIYQLAGSELLMRLINDLTEVLYRFRVSLLADTEAARRSLADHRTMLLALEKGQVAEAVSACREHVLAGGRWMLEKIEPDES